MKGDQMPTNGAEKINTARWLEIVKPTLRAFADRSYQERAWFNPGPKGPVSSPTELICNLLDDFSFHRTSQDPSFELSNAQRAACLRFAEMVRAYTRAHKGRFDDKAVIDDPEWEKIRVAAGDLLKILPA